MAAMTLRGSPTTSRNAVQVGTAGAGPTVSPSPKGPPIITDPLGTVMPLATGLPAGDVSPGRVDTGIDPASADAGPVAPTDPLDPAVLPHPVAVPTIHTTMTSAMRGLRLADLAHTGG
jgi:hypothetical protein